MPYWPWHSIPAYGPLSNRTFTGWVSKRMTSRCVGTFCLLLFGLGDRLSQHRHHSQIVFVLGLASRAEFVDTLWLGAITFVWIHASSLLFSSQRVARSARSGRPCSHSRFVLRWSSFTQSQSSKCDR